LNYRLSREISPPSAAVNSATVNAFTPP